DIPIMRSPAMFASPMPYSKTCDTFRATECAAPGAGLGRESLADDFENSSVPQGFVAELVPEHGPAGIQHGFCHACLCQLGRVHIANDDVTVLTHDPRRMFVQKVFSGILYLGVKRSRSALLAAPLRLHQSCFVLPIKGWHLDLTAIGERREVLQAKVDSDGRPIFCDGFLDFDIYVKVPASARIFGKARGLDLSIGGNGARIPKAIFAAKDYDRAAGLIDFKSACRVKRNPPERASLARAPFRTTLGGVARVGKFPCDGAQRIAVNSEFGGSTGHQPHEIKFARPSSAPPLRLPLCFAAVVPRIVNRPGHAPQMLGAGLILDTVAVCENHEAGRSSVRADWRSRARQALPRLAASLFVLNLYQQVNLKASVRR